jgi:hypothetical protein
MIKRTFAYTRCKLILQSLAAEWERTARSGDIVNARGAEWVRGVVYGIRLANREIERYNVEVGDKES